MLKELLEITRSYRRFDGNRSISDSELREIAACVRLCPSAANLQRVRVKIVNDSLQNEVVFSELSFAAYLKDWKGPEEHERPVAYFVLLTEREPDVNLAIDVGICAEAIVLSARERGIGACMFRSFNKDSLSQKLGTEGLIPALVIAFGYPAETVVLDEARDNDLKYYRDADGVHHVPNLSLDDIVIE